MNAYTGKSLFYQNINTEMSLNITNKCPAIKSMLSKTPSMD